MYQVIKMYGDWEPWWFIEGWQEDIVLEEEFEDWQEALDFYQKEWQSLQDEYPSYHSQKNFLATFWTKSEARWCEDCDDELQQFHSILLLEDKDIVPKEKYILSYEQRNDTITPPYTCKLKF
ncbi:DUF1033 family protein [Streptococcus didelphis]|uniref:DUF1033 family protein n=1 Tax=Streptococcus didelphis TaxID=102886 RepID=A0ABY9LIS5_9STRE|nr:DUF1033 family protein [Streptococcus didelphis]WMB28775.1 DUF1033 family protein [Streptococcus didelphis]WMB29441.1 DUF1033 family protein [Streptococcus didelphis]